MFQILDFTGLRLLYFSRVRRLSSKPSKAMASRVRSAISLNKRSYRDRHNRILLEGLRIVHDALLANMEPITIFYSNKNLIDKLTSKLPSRYFVPVDDKTMKNLSTALTPPGIVGVFKKPCSQLKIKSNVLPLTVICDRVKDPSNLGTIVRTCAAAGCQALITTEYSTDLWDPKVLRGGAGGHFRVPLYGLLSWKQIADMLGDDTRLYLAESDNTENIQPPTNTHTWKREDI
ncbi:rRNA methyltransferase 3, mitochondrial isoform X2 [Nematostella vectensis]|uniref:rRNA methyltransferase 3, mitochondrial isoform X2 n=1 Tax=Nematostella vectensis TaxID=45351 RepID=UPI0020779429|nr:rRNA methyltransferase 3, mitochondrial isoform X2 [Nematostella vectensis]